MGAEAISCPTLVCFDGLNTACCSHRSIFLVFMVCSVFSACNSGFGLSIRLSPQSRFKAGYIIHRQSVIAMFFLYLWHCWFFFRLQFGLSISSALKDISGRKQNHRYIDQWNEGFGKQIVPSKRQTSHTVLFFIILVLPDDIYYSCSITTAEYESISTWLNQAGWRVNTSLSCMGIALFVCLVGFLTSSSTTRLYRGRVPRQSL